MSQQIVRELHEQYKAACEMFMLAIQNCPAPLWERVFGDASPFWKEAYHTVFYLRYLACSLTETPSRTPFGIDLDPRLVVKPKGLVSQEQMGSFLKQAREHIDNLFSTLTLDQLQGTDNIAPDRYRCVYHRLLYGMRHCQHHTGKLTGYLFSNGIDYDPWR